MGSVPRALSGHDAAVRRILAQAPRAGAHCPQGFRAVAERHVWAGLVNWGGLDMQAGQESDVSGLLHAWAHGDLEARDRLVPLVYQELRRRAAAYLRRERVGHTLQPTALVHEVFVRLIRQDHAAWKNRSQFFGVASHMMRRILVDGARTAKGTRRQDGHWVRVPFDDARMSRQPLDVSILDLDVALTELAVFDARKSNVAELRFFGGLTLDETSKVLDLSVATVEREWQTARAWLYARLTKRPHAHDA